MAVGMAMGSNHGNSGNHGNSADHSNKGRGNGKSGEDHGNRKNYGKPDHVDSDISFSRARSLAVNYGLVGYKALPGYREEFSPRQTVASGDCEENAPGIHD